MFRLFRNNSPFTVIVLFIFTLLVKLHVLMAPQAPRQVSGHFMYNFLLQGLNAVFHSGAFAFTLLAVFLLFIQALYLRNIAVRHKLFPRNTYMPAFTYLLLTSIYPDFSYFSETILLNFLLMGAMDIMFSFSQTSQPRKHIYNAALLFSLAALFQFTALTYFLLLLVGMVLFRPFNLGEWSVAIMGYTTPVYFLACILFLADDMMLLTRWPHIGFSLASHIASPFHLIVTLGGLFMLLGTGVFAMQQNVAMSNIYIRRDWIALSFYLIISLMVAFATDKEVSSAWLITIPALSIIVTHALALEKNKRFSNFIFYFSLLFLIFCLWANK